MSKGQSQAIAQKKKFMDACIRQADGTMDTTMETIHAMLKHAGRLHKVSPNQEERPKATDGDFRSLLPIKEPTTISLKLFSKSMPQ